MAENQNHGPNPWEANDPNNTSFYPEPPPASSYVRQLHKLAVGMLAANVGASIYFFVTVGREQEDFSFMALLFLCLYPFMAIRRGMNPRKVRLKELPTTERGWWRRYEIVRRSEYVLAIWWSLLNCAFLLLSTVLGWQPRGIFFFAVTGLTAYLIQWQYKRQLEKNTAHLE